MRIAAASALVWMSVAPCAWSQEVLSVPASLYERQAAKGRLALAQELSPARLFSLEAPRKVSLEGLPESARASLLNGAVAVHRETPEGLMTSGEWSTMADGRRVWRVAVESPGAASLRLHFTRFDVEGGEVWLSAGGEAAAPAEARALTGRGPLGDGEFWSASVFGETVWVEYVPAADRTDGVVPFGIDRISHYLAGTKQSDPVVAGLERAARTAEAQDAAGAAGQGREAASCQLEAKCFPEYEGVGSGIAHLRYERNGFGYVCSGALVNSTSQRHIPYLLTADHCIQNDAEARTLESYFFYEASICGGANSEEPPMTSSRVLGAKFLAGGALEAGDYSLLLLSDAPDKAMFLGWTTADVAVGAPVYGIHHPSGSYKRISFGQRVIDEELVIGAGEDAEYAPSDKYWKVEFTRGRVEGGSSGSPLFNANNQVVGTLTAGPSASEARLCALDPFEAFYGRFVNGFPRFRAYLEDTEPASLTQPANGATLPGATVDFAWSKGTSSDQFKLHIGTTPGGRELAVEDAGNTSFHRVNYLPTDGRRIYVRFHYRMLGTWRFTDYAFTAAKDSGRKVTVRVVNKLLYPVQVKANGENLMIVGGGAAEARDFAVPRTLVVSYEMIRPVVDGAPAGVPVTGYFPGTGAPMGTIPFTITNTTGSEPVFAPVLYNGTGQPVTLVMNSGLPEEQSCNCTAAAGANGLDMGYYPLLPASNIRAVNGGTSSLYQNFVAFVEPGAGIVRASFTALR